MGGVGFDGHSSSNDDLFNGPTPYRNPDGSLTNQDPNFQWGGVGTTYGNGFGADPTAPNGATQDVNRYRGLADQYRNAQGPTIDYGQANGYASRGNGYLGMADQARGLDMQSRGAQLDALSMERQAAMGLVPSAAQIQMKQGNQDAMASQLAMAAGARGAAGLASAQYNAAGNTAALQRQNVADTSALRANEQAAARSAYMQGATGVRSSDQGTRGLDYQGAGLSYNAAGMTAGWAQQQAALGEQSRQFNQGMGLNYEQMGWNTNNAYLNAQMAKAENDRLKWAQQGNWDQTSNQMVSKNIDGGVGAAGGLLMFM